MRHITLVGFGMVMGFLLAWMLALIFITNPPAASVPQTAVPVPSSAQQPLPAELLREARATARDEAKAWLFDYAVRVVPIGLSAVILALGGVAAVVTTGVKQTIASSVTFALNKMQRELHGSIAACQALVLWRADRNNLDDALSVTEEAFGDLKPEDDHYWVIKNNLAYYYAETGRATYAKKAAEFALELRNRYPGDIDYLTTYARVVAAYPDAFLSPKLAVMEAKQMMDEIQARRDCASHHKENAARHAGELMNALSRL